MFLLFHIIHMLTIFIIQQKEKNVTVNSKWRTQKIIRQHKFVLEFSGKWQGGVLSLRCGNQIEGSGYGQKGKDIVTDDDKNNSKRRRADGPTKESKEQWDWLDTNSVYQQIWKTDVVTLLKLDKDQKCNNLEKKMVIY